MDITFKNVIGKAPEQNLDTNSYNLFAGLTSDLFENQLTKIPIGCTIEIPDGYMPYIIPDSKLVDQSCVVSVNNGVPFGVKEFDSVTLKKGVAGKVRIPRDSFFATLIFIKY